MALLVADVAVGTKLIQPSNWPSVLVTMAPFMLCAMAQVPVVISGGGGVDLSVGPTAGFVNVVIVQVLVGHGVTSPAAVLPAALAIGALVGLVNGFLVAYVRIAPIVATLGSYLFLSGFAAVVLPTAGGTAPGWLSALGGSVLGIPGDLFLFVGVALLWLPLMHTAFRRNLYAVGCDERAAFTAGVNIARVRILAYVLGGVLAAVAGLAFTAVLGSGDATIGPPYTLLSLAGVALGGVALTGGRGGMLGAAAGGAVLYLVQDLLSVAGVQVFYAQVAYGVIVIFALGLNSYMDVRRHRRAALAEAWASSRPSSSKPSVDALIDAVRLPGSGPRTGGSGGAERGAGPMHHPSDSRLSS